MEMHSLGGDPAVLRADFEREGYAVVREVIPPAVLDQVTSDVSMIVGAQLSRLGLPIAGSSQLFADLVALHDASIPVYLQTVRLCAKLTSVFSMYLAPGIAEIARTLGVSMPIWQTAPVVHLMAEKLRIPGGYYGVDVHQDWPALQSSLDAVTIWIPLFDVDEHTFPLEVAPRSHIGGLLGGSPAEHVYAIDPSALEGMKFLPLGVPRGGVALMSGFTVHRSGLKGGDSLRFAFSHRYENAAETTFINRVYPTAQGRTIRRDLIEPGFPEKDEIRRIYGVNT